jgi:hypothetical protein
VWFVGLLIQIHVLLQMSSRNGITLRLRELQGVFESIHHVSALIVVRKYCSRSSSAISSGGNRCDNLGRKCQTNLSAI